MFGQRDDSSNTNNGLVTPTVAANMLPVGDPMAQMPAAQTMANSTGMQNDPFAATSLEATPMPPQPTIMPPAQPMSVPVAASTGDDLISMKQEALKHLQPLVDNLQQTPEEEFRTLMMMIQATDDKSMLKKALESAKRIPEEKARAQAMLDVINEINYFTQSGQV